MSRIRSDLQIEKGLPSGNKVLAKPDGETEVVQTEPFKVSPTTWSVNSASIYENTPGQYEIPSLAHAKDVDTAFDETGRFFKWNPAGYFELHVDLTGGVNALQPGDNVSELVNDAGYLNEAAHDALPQDNPHGVTKAQVGLSDVDNTSDMDKPVSTAQGQAIAQAESDAKQYTDDEIVALNLGSASQSDVGDFVATTEKGVANGVATLDGGGKVLVTQLPSSVMTLEGQWNASTNTPTLSDGTGDPGMVYEVTTSGTQDLGSGNLSFNVGDFVVYGNDGKWYRSINSNEVVEVNGKKGVVVLDPDDLDDSTTTHKFVSQSEKDAIGTALQPGDLPPPQDLQSVTDVGNTTTNPVKFRNGNPTGYNSYEVEHLYIATTNDVGAIAIRFPNAPTSTIKFEVSLSSYYVNQIQPVRNLTYHIWGRTSSGNGWVSNRYSAGVVGSAYRQNEGFDVAVPKIRFAADGNGDPVILIGDTTTQFRYSHVSITRFETVMGDEIADVVIEVVDSEDEFTGIVEPQLNENISVDMVDGMHASDFATASQGAKADTALQPGDLPPPQDLQSVTDAGNTTTDAIWFKNDGQGPTNMYNMYEIAHQRLDSEDSGFFQIKIIGSSTNFKMDISVGSRQTGNYTPSRSLNYTIVANYNADGGWLNNGIVVGVTGSANIDKGEAVPRIRFTTTPDGHAAILIGDSGSGFRLSHASITRLEELWPNNIGDIEMSIITNLDGYGAIYEPQMNKGISVDLLDGYHASDFATASQGAKADTALQPTDDIDATTLDGRNKHLYGFYTQIGGQARADLGMSGLYDRTTTTDADLRGGSITATVVAGSVTVPGSLYRLVNAQGDQLYFRDITPDAELDIIIDLGEVNSAYARGRWQPFFQKRHNTNAEGRFRHIKVYISQDNTSWYSSTGSEWEITNFYDDPSAFEPSGFWMGKEGSTGVISNWRYVKFELKDFVQGSNGSYGDGIYIVQLGMRHVSEIYARQYMQWRDYQNKLATAAQGALADTAVQPGDLATVATTGSSTDLSDSSDIVRNSADSFLSEQKINQIVTLTQAEYDAIVNKNPNIMYVIPEI